MFSSHGDWATSWTSGPLRRLVRPQLSASLRCICQEREREREKERVGERAERKRTEIETEKRKRTFRWDQSRRGRRVRRQTFTEDRQEEWEVQSSRREWHLVT